jgi:hypothetical protein
MEASGDFWSGFLTGFLAAGLFGFAIQQLSFHYQRLKKIGQPQTTVAKTADTPGGVVGRAMESGCMLVVIAILLLAGCWLLATSLAGL